MAQPPGKTESFVDLLSSARGEVPRMTEEVELPTLFSPPADNVPLVAKEVENLQPGRKVRMVSYLRTFVVWRPWSKCDRCKASIAKDEISLPDVGDYTCPHVQLVEYKEVKDRTLSGEALRENEEHFQLHDGTRCVEISWLETDPEFLEEMERKAKEAAEKAVYPPNPEAVFSKKDPDQKEAPTSEKD